MSSVTWRQAQGGPIKHTHTHTQTHTQPHNWHDTCTTTPTTTVSGLKYPASLTAYFIIIRGIHAHAQPNSWTHMDRKNNAHMQTLTLSHTQTWCTHTYKYRCSHWVFQSKEKQWSTQAPSIVLLEQMFRFSNFDLFIYFYFLHQWLYKTVYFTTQKWVIASVSDWGCE